MDDVLAKRDALLEGLPERLVHERLRLGLSQTHIIKTLGISGMTLSRYENTGKEWRKPSFDVLVGLALLGYDMPYVVTGQTSGSGDDVSDDENQLITLYRQSNNPQQLLKMLKAYEAS